MRYCFTIIIILISFSSFPKVRTLTFFLEEGIEKCFHENLPSEADLHVTVTFIDLIPGIDPTLRVSDSNHLIIKELPLKKKTRFMFTSETVGRHDFCIITANRGNWIKENKKYRFEIKIHIGEDVGVMNKTAKVGDLAGIQEGYEKLNNEVDFFLLKQEMIALKDEKLFHDNLETDSKVIILTIIESVVLLGLAIYQVLVLRRFFIAKNLY